MLSLLLFNWVGYRVFISWCESHAEDRLEARLDADRYDKAQLILLRISAELLPYSNSSASFERATGEIEIGHVLYSYVGKRLYNDSVEFLCIPEKAVNQLKKAKIDFFTLVNDLQKTGHGKVPGSSGKADGNGLKICLLQDLFPRLYHFDAYTEAPRPQEATVLLSGYPRVSKRPPRFLV